MLDMADGLDMIELTTHSSENIASTAANMHQITPQNDAASIDEVRAVIGK